MKKFTAILMLVSLSFIANSCKHDDEHIVDCLEDSLLTELKHSPDPSNSKVINYSIQYSGTNKITYVKWTFGDGTPVKNIKTPGAVPHTYAGSGTYQVKADITLSRLGSSCTMTLDKDVVID
ncbi:PKD domain-containing protein [Flavobacterium ajazii]|uniref:PKD domain-containing protein n=1 Tax=Flavobacterium ajazii TaxID=2692318 RepID=UPI0013D38CAE|nr:PKD domain-containing protein [Flavobacterium ajazii]